MNKKQFASLTLAASFLFISVAAILHFLGKVQGEPNEARSEIREALELINNARTYPETELPSAGLAPAFAAKRADLLRKSAHQPDVPPWRTIGPTNIAGRTLVLALNPQNPNTIYAGSASGGLWRSYNAGVGAKAWHKLETGFPVLGVATIAIAPDDSGTLYIGTGEVYGSAQTFPGVAIRTTRGSYGIGILKSTDAGQSWQKSLDWLYSQHRGVQKIAIDPKRSNVVWAATTEGVYKSSDAGATWQRSLAVPVANDLVINPQHPDTVFAACGNMGSIGHGIYRSFDGGINWRKMDLGANGPQQFLGKAQLAMAASSPDIVMASIGNSNGYSETATWLCKTTDSGETWQVVSTLDYSSIQGWYSHDVAISPTDPNEIWTAGQPFSPLISTDGGANLQYAENLGLVQPATEIESYVYPDLTLWADYHDIVYHPTDPDIIYFANDGGVFRTTDGGKTIENCNGGLQTTQFYNGTASASSDSNFYIGGMQDNMSAGYRGSPQWQRLGITADGSWCAINQQNNDIIYLSYQGLYMLRYTDGGNVDGANAQIVAPPNRRTINFIAPYVLSPVDNLTMYAGSAFVHKSSNGGLNWQETNNNQPLDGNPVLSLAISRQSTDVVYAGTTPISSRARLFRTDNGGNSWLNITGNLPDRYPTDIAVDPNNDRIVYVTFGGFDSAHIFKSENGGGNWTDMGAGLPDVPAWAVAVDPFYNQHIYFGNDLGVYFSEDGGATWQVFTDGLPEAIIAMDLSISPANRALRVATHGNGVYERKLVSSRLELIADDDFQPSDFVLAQNFPNPFNPATTIRYTLKKPQHVRLKIYNILGKEVAILVDALRAPGTYSISVSASHLGSSGVYFYRLEAGGFSQICKMALTR